MTRSLLFSSSQTLCLLIPSTTFSLVCWSLSPSFIIFNLKLFLSGSYQVCCQRYFLATWSHGSCPFQAIVDLQRVPCGHRSQNLFANTSCTNSCWPEGSICSSSSPSISLAGSRGRSPGPPCPWLLVPEPCGHTWYASGLIQQVLTQKGLCRGNSLRTGQALVASLQSAGS